jgi:hypothetical protein
METDFSVGDKVTLNELLFNYGTTTFIILSINNKHALLQVADYRNAHCVIVHPVPLPLLKKVQ